MSRRKRRQPLLVYDGDCPFCTSAARWIERRWRKPAGTASWRSLGSEGLAEIGLSEKEAREKVQWIDEKGRRSSGHRAAARALERAAGGYRVLGTAIRYPPGSWLARPGYWLVSRNRHRLKSIS